MCGICINKGVTVLGCLQNWRLGKVLKQSDGREKEIYFSVNFCDVVIGWRIYFFALS